MADMCFEDQTAVESVEGVSPRPRQRGKQEGIDVLGAIMLCIAGFGARIGIATMGQPAIAKIQFSDYIFPAFDQLVNEAAKYRYRSGGQFNVGHLTATEDYHSQSPEGFMGTSGQIVIPRSPIQAKGLLLASIRDVNPVIFMEPKILYRSVIEQVPIDNFELPLERAEDLMHGADLMLLTWGRPVYHYETALRLLTDPSALLALLVPKTMRSACVELIDLRTVLPWDVETVIESVKRTGRLVIVHEVSRTAGVGTETSAEVQSKALLGLDAPMRRVTSWDTPSPRPSELFLGPNTPVISPSLQVYLDYNFVLR
ncbi:thiamine diphosphate-binding protein [Lactifluus subvellereus]|nr:thiamine diphosphate-binding protein [Lactifluus subvellereus]